jgi:hypothetical protein
MQAPLSKPTWIVSSAKRLLICVRWRSAWRVATATGVRRCVQFALFSKGSLANRGRQNLEAWEEAKKEIAKIPEHPNKIPSERTSAAGTSAAGPSAVRRDSTATINGR